MSERLASEIGMRPQATIGATEMAELLAALNVVGYEPAALGETKRADALPDDLAPRTPASLAVMHFDRAARCTGDRLIGLHAGAHVKPRGALVHLMMSSASLRAALAAMERFSAILVDTFRVRLERRDATARLVCDLGDPILADDRHVVDYALMATAHVLRGTIGAAFRLHHVCVRHDPAPGEAEEAVRAFECPVRFRQPWDCLVFHAADLDVRPEVANPLVAEQMEKFALALAARAAPPAVSVGVADAVRAGLAAGVRADRRSVARRLGMSDATLMRRLAEARTTFKAVREGVLWEVVDALMTNPSLKIEAIATSAGFTDSAAFAKAVRRRAGCSATAYRRRIAARLRRRQRTG